MITDIQAKSAKPKEKPYRLGDGHGLYLRVDPTGKKYFILRYWEDGKERQMSLGPYPLLSLRDAREKRDEIQNARARGINPFMQKNVNVPSFAAVVSEWLNVRMTEKAPQYLRTIQMRLHKYILPALGDRPVDAISSGEVLRLCRKIENLGFIDTAKRIKIICGQVFRYGIAAGYLENDPTTALSGALRPHIQRHHPAPTDPAGIGAIFAAIRAYPYPVMRSALLFALYTVARSGEIRHAEWTEIKGDVWDIPPEKMKMKRRHLVPLSPEALKVLEELRPFTGAGRWLFPSARQNGLPISDNSMRVTLRSLGFDKETITPHGFRSMFSTVANEHGFNSDVIERTLAHVEYNSVRRAYNHAEYLDQRRNLLEWWSKWLNTTC